MRHVSAPVVDIVRKRSDEDPVTVTIDALKKVPEHCG